MTLRLRSLSTIVLPLIALAAASLLVSCATGMGIPPIGGPADSTAPRIVSSEPANGSTRFRGQVVKVDFSEYVEDRGFADAVVITPITEHPPEYSWSGRSVEIEFDRPLLEDRTYAITFGAGIRDLSGNRLGQPFTLRLSTGNTIDSGVIRGQVLGAGKRRVFVFAYLIPPGDSGFLDTLDPDLTRPDFIAPVADDGSFSLEALPPGRFQLLAVADEFGDQLVTRGTDAVGVAGRIYAVDSAYTPVAGAQLRLAPAAADITAPALYSARSLSRTTSELRFSEPIDTATIDAQAFILSASGTSVPVLDAWRSPANRLAVLLAHGELAAGAPVTVSARGLRDTAGNDLLDSASAATFTASEARDTLPPVFLPIGYDTTHAWTWPDTLLLSFDESIRTTDFGGAVVLRDTARGIVRFRLDRINPAQFRGIPIDTFPGFSRGVLEIDLRRFSDLAGNRVDTMFRQRIAVAPQRQTGSISGTVVDSVSPNASHIVTAQLVGTNRVFSRTVRAGEWSMDDVPEGEYRITAFRDSNGNGVYDFGSAHPFRPAEEFVEWRGSVRVRPRWATAKVTLVFGE